MKPQLPNMYYQAYFRTAKGGLGIPYANCLAELMGVFGGDAQVLDERPARFRLALLFDVPEQDIAPRAGRLGYTLGIVRVTQHPVTGKATGRTMRHRWPVEWLREGDRELHFEEVFVADEQGRLAASPHAFDFPQVDDQGEVSWGLGRRVNRRLSPLDARFCANVCGLPDSATVLEPFAGLCVLADALAARGLAVSACDIDTRLRVGLGRHASGRALIADARRLPFASGGFDGVVTEPPYHRGDRVAVMQSIAELARVVRSGGRVCLLVADFMAKELCHAARSTSLVLLNDHDVPRHGLRSQYLVFSRA